MEELTQQKEPTFFKSLDKLGDNDGFVNAEIEMVDPNPIARFSMNHVEDHLHINELMK